MHKIFLSALCLFALTLYSADRYDTFIFGVDYYPEHWPESYWEQDAKWMKACHVNTARIAEFGWYYLEPEEGVYQFDLFDRAIEELGRQGIKVILGTPTAAPPKWLTHKYPSVLYVGKDGRAWNDQGRRHYNYNSPVYREFCRKIVKAMAEHYQDNPNVIGWQIDNEFNCIIDEFYSEADHAAFLIWLQNKYDSLDELNKRWGTKFWSQWYTDWAQISLPTQALASHNPSLMLDFKRFISESVISFQREQVDVIRKYCPEMWITHNDYHAWNINFYTLSEDLDIFAYDNYPCFHNPPQYKMGHFLTMARGFRGNFMVMEQQTGPGGGREIQRTPRPGEMDLWAMQAIAHGADGMVHFRWRTARSGIEEYWHGVLDQDNVPRGRYREFEREGEKIEKISREIFGSKVESEIAVLRDFECEWAYKYQYLSDELDVRAPFDHFFQAASELKFNIDFVSITADFSGYKLIFAPFQLLMDKSLANRFKKYVEMGGTLLVSAHTAIKNRDNVMTDQVFPAYVYDLFGVERDFFTCYETPSASKNSIQFDDGSSVPVHIFADGLLLKGAASIAAWQSDSFAGTPAVTEHHVKKGKAVYYASFFNDKSARYLLERYTEELGLKPIIKNISEDIEVTRRTKGQSDYTFILNHSNEVRTIQLDSEYTDMLTEKHVSDSLTLDAFGVFVLKSNIAER